MKSQNSFGAAGQLRVGQRTYDIFRLAALEKAGFQLSRIPYSIKILLENLLRCEDGSTVKKSDIEYVAAWDTSAAASEINFRPARVVLQDFTGVPCVVDLAAMRDALAKMGADPKKANPLVPVDLVIDHSVQVDHFGTKDSFLQNSLIEFQRNQERYSFLRWGQSAFQNFRAVPPETGIVHQVNLEYLAPVVMTSGTSAYPDTVVGTDSHTTMINGLGVVGWGVGGIEAEACMLGQPATMLLPEVIGFKLTGRLPEGATATDLVLTATQMLRKKGVVGKFVEYYGDGLNSLSIADRATLGNMAPEYGATIGVFPIDEAALDYLRMTNRPPELIELVEAYAKEQGLFRIAGAPDPVFNDTLHLELSTVVPSLAGPKRPQDRIALPDVKKNFLDDWAPLPPDGGNRDQWFLSHHSRWKRSHSGHYQLHQHVKSFRADRCWTAGEESSRTGADLQALGEDQPRSRLQSRMIAWKTPPPEPLEALNFNLVGFGCTTCIGNSGPLPDEVAAGVTKEKLTVAAVLSGNRNFEGRVNPQVKANYSPRRLWSWRMRLPAAWT